METEEENKSHSSNEEGVLVCDICHEIIMGKVGERDTLLDHMVEKHNRALSPENFTEPTLRVAQDTGYPNKCLMTQTPGTDTSEEDEPTDTGDEREENGEEDLTRTLDWYGNPLPLWPGGRWTTRPMSPDSSGSPDPRSTDTRSPASDEDIGSWVIDEYGIPIYGGPNKTPWQPNTWLDQLSGETVLDLLYNGDPSHPSIGIVNPLKEKAASAAGALLNAPEGLSQLPIPNILKKLVGCWNHRIYRHRY